MMSFGSIWVFAYRLGFVDLTSFSYQFRFEKFMLGFGWESL